MTSIPQLLDNIIKTAITKNASDIHLEPLENHLRIRLRIDGELVSAEPLSKEKHSALLSRLKIMVNLDISENRLPQDGRTCFDKVDLRVSIIPTIHGEKAVIRLLSQTNKPLTLKELGMRTSDLELYQQLISKKHGLILVTGPTGSGKTTTLYATLLALDLLALNITTIEDPIEYKINGINQIQVNPKIGLTFSKGLRHILRQDPDVIMLGEIRDTETAKIAVQSALTGHLVFSTLHTNDAPSAITRLIDLGIEKYLVEAVLLGVVAQRLAKRSARGRMGIFEIMQGSIPQNNMQRLIDDGLEKVRLGLITKTEAAKAVYLG